MLDALKKDRDREVLRRRSGINVAAQTLEQIGQDLNITSNQLSETGYLLAGDYIQLGSGSTTSLHKVLVNADTDGSGNSTLTLWPNVRTAPANGATVTVQSTAGRWRLAGNESEWSVNEASIYGISFSAMEAI